MTTFKEYLINMCIHDYKRWSAFALTLNSPYREDAEERARENLATAERYKKELPDDIDGWGFTHWLKENKNPEP